MGLVIGGFIGAAIGLMLGAMLAGSDSRDEYADTVEELGRALREAYGFIHISGEWEEFAGSGFVVDAPTPSPLTSYTDERDERAARGRARYMGADDAPEGLDTRRRFR
jgi:hypothetical protein